MRDCRNRDEPSPGTMACMPCCIKDVLLLLRVHGFIFSSPAVKVGRARLCAGLVKSSRAISWFEYVCEVVVMGRIVIELGSWNMLVCIFCTCRWAFQHWASILSLMNLLVPGRMRILWRVRNKSREAENGTNEKLHKWSSTCSECKKRHRFKRNVGTVQLD